MVAGMSTDKRPPLPSIAEWVDIMWQRHKDRIVDDALKRAEASRRNGFQKGHEHYKRKEPK